MSSTEPGTMAAFDSGELLPGAGSLTAGFVSVERLAMVREVLLVMCCWKIRQLYKREALACGGNKAAVGITNMYGKQAPFRLVWTEDASSRKICICI